MIVCLVDGFERHDVPKVWEAFCAGELGFQKKNPELKKFKPKRTPGKSEMKRAS